MLYNLTEEKTEGYGASADHEPGHVSSVFVPAAAVSVDSRVVTKVFPVGTEFDPVRVDQFTVTPLDQL